MGNSLSLPQGPLSSGDFDDVTLTVKDIQGRLRYVRSNLFKLYDSGSFHSDLDTYFSSINTIDIVLGILSRPDAYDTSGNFWNVVLGQLEEVAENIKQLEAHSAILDRAIQNLRAKRSLITKALGGEVNGSRRHFYPQAHRARALEKISLGADGFTSLHALAQFRDTLTQTLSHAGPQTGTLGIFDLSQLDKRSSVLGRNHIDDTVVRKALEIAQRNQDGLLAMQISNRIQTEAVNDTVFDTNIEASLSLKDHVPNLGDDTPITINTLEYGNIEITQLKKISFVGAEGTYYQADVVHNNQVKKFLIREELFVVGDLSRKILGRFDIQGKFIPENSPCTVKSIRSQKKNQKTRENPMESKNTNLLGRAKNWMKSLFR